MIYGAGIDIIEIQRIEKIISARGGRFVARVFSSDEIRYCNSRAHPALHFAARFAAKESFLKSLGLGLGMGVRLQDVEITTDPRGKPEMKLHGGAAELTSRLGIHAIHVSLSHTRGIAAASVILETLNE